MPLKFGSRFFARWALSGMIHGCVISLVIVLLAYVGWWAVCALVLVLSGVASVIGEIQATIADEIGERIAAVTDATKDVVAKVSAPDERETKS